MLHFDPPLAIASLDVLLAVWCAVLGGVVGSFLNVVVYRVPANLSIVHPGSHCPQCQRPIRWYDNVPVLGWLWLKGQCRDCHLPIAARYPLVEAFCAVMFLAVMLVEVYVDATLPRRDPLLDEGAYPALVEALARAGYQLFLLATLLPAALIAWDEKPVRAKLFWPAIMMGAVLPIGVGDFLRPIAACAYAGPWTDGVFGAAAGAGCGLVLSGIGGRFQGVVLAMLCIGLFLGWQAVLIIAATGTLLTVVAAIAAPRLGRLPIWLFVATLAWIVAWRWLPF